MEDNNNNSVVLVDVDFPQIEKENKRLATGDDTKDLKKVSALTLFKHTTRIERICMIIGMIAALGQGILMPVYTIYMGNMINSFSIDFSSLTPSTSRTPMITRELNSTSFYESEPPNLKQFDIDMDSIMQTFDKSILYDCIYVVLMLGGVSFVSMFVMTATYKVVAETHSMRLRKKYMHSTITQEMGWYDSKKAGEITERFGGDIEKIENGTGTKFAQIFSALSSFLGGWIIGFVKGWQLALIILAVTPLLIIAAGSLGFFMRKLTLKVQSLLAKAGGVAEEVIISMRTVTSLNCQEYSAKRYEKILDEVLKVSSLRVILLSICFGVLFFLIFCIYGLAFWYGAYLVREDIMSAGKVMNVFMAVLMGAMAISQLAPSIQAFGEARGCAYEIYETIDRVSQIYPFNPDGKVVELKGDIKFEKVKFNYPSRPTVQVLKGVSFNVKPSETLALVGPSGCGKSTTVGLLERFYNYSEGKISIDGIRIEDINISCLREQIGIVGQEPVLFAMTIKENIKLGSKTEVTDEQVYEACKMANIYEFIMNLKDQFETMVGERGVQLSGGQKQRIAIARALIKNPKILILDEATSALDTESEGIVQQALENASKGRTTIVIAHRLSTVRKANQIIVIEKGLIKEEGTHSELMGKKGLYYTLVNKQMISRHGKNKKTDLKKKTDENEKKERKKTKEKKPKKLKVKAPKPSSEKKKKETTLEDENLLPDEDSTSSETSSASLNSISPSISPAPKKVDDSKAIKKLNRGEREFEEEDLTQHHPYPTKKTSIFRLFKYIKLNLQFYIMGVIGSVCNGAVMPVFAIVFSEIMVVLLTPSLNDELREKNKKDANFWAFMFIIVAIVAGLISFFQVLGLTMSGERLMRIIRGKLFRSFMRQNIGYFDDKANSTGILTTRLATDAHLIDAAVGMRIGILFHAVSALLVGIIIGFTGSWIMALIILACLPIIVGVQFFNVKFTIIAQVDLKKAYEDSTNFAVEAVESIRTVTMLNQEEYFMKRFKDELIPAHRYSIKTSFSAAVASGGAGFVQMGMAAVAMYVLSRLLESGSGTIQGAMRAQMAITFGAMSITMASVIQSEMTKAMVAIKHFFHTLDRSPLIDSESTKGLKKEIKGEIEFKDIEFIYPTRKQTTILRGFNLKIPVGTSIALVGPSGCGKSTTVGMIERFYDPKDGKVLIDGEDITNYNIRKLRSQIGLVSQEPVLFGMTIRENIKMGAVDREVTDEEIIAACKKANAHKFVMSLPEGYDTQTGEKGAQLSGGQKQRIAIARSLIADPKILILDEATSALDTESEGIVQQALDKAAEGRTTIMIAHRLSTVQKADCIAVIKKGQVVEMGTHQELIADQSSEYYRLAKKQLKREIPVQK